MFTSRNTSTTSLLVRCLVASLLLNTPFSLLAQYYLRGEVLDEKKNPLSNVRMLSHNLKNYFYTGPSGSFGITTKNRYDSLTLSLEGYETLTYVVDAQNWQSLTMKEDSLIKSKQRLKMISIYEDYIWADNEIEYSSNETYLRLLENPIAPVSKYPKSNVTLSINKASYSNVRRFLNYNTKVPEDAVRLEEMINYYNLQYTKPGDDSMFHFSSTLSTCPWDAAKQLLYLNFSAKKVDVSKVPSGNFVFLIDVSGSMDQENRLPLIKSAFRLFVNHLRPVDTVCIVTYGGEAIVWLRPTSEKINLKLWMLLNLWRLKVIHPENQL